MLLSASPSAETIRHVLYPTATRRDHRDSASRRRRPDDEDLVPAPLPPGGHFPVVPEPFSRLVRLMVICGRISDLLNGSRGAPRTFGSAPPADLAERVESLQQELSDYYKNLPDSLMWSASNFKSWIMRNKGGVSKFAFVTCRPTSRADMVNCLARSFSLYIVLVSASSANPSFTAAEPVLFLLAPQPTPSSLCSSIPPSSPPMEALRRPCLALRIDLSNSLSSPLGWSPTRSSLRISPVRSRW